MTLYTSEIVARVTAIADKSVKKAIEENWQEATRIESSTVRGRLLSCFLPHLLRRQKEQIMETASRKAVKGRTQYMNEYWAKVGAPVPVGETEEHREYRLELQASEIKLPVWYQRLTDRGITHPGDPY